VLVSAMDVASPEQIAWDAGVATKTGIGFTVTTAVIAVPTHPFAEGVMV
jgi:hypothetical protein